MKWVASTFQAFTRNSRQYQLLTSRDACVRFLADRSLKRELNALREKFRPAALARDALASNPAANRKSLARAAKAVVKNDDNEQILHSLRSLERQGQMSRCTDLKCAPIWAKVVGSLSDEEMKFALNAAVDILPHNANLYLWKKRRDSLCPLCNNNQSLLHILNNYSAAINLRRYNKRHDTVLQEIAVAVQSHLPPISVLTADIGDSYEFPLHIVPTDLRPDLVWWDDTQRSLCLAELTVCFESNFDEAAMRKTTKYTDLAEQAERHGYHSTLFTLQVGSRGVPDYKSSSALATLLNMPSRDLTDMLESVTRAAIISSFSIWCSRNRQS